MIRFPASGALAACAAAVLLAGCSGGSERSQDGPSTGAAPPSTSAASSNSAAPQAGSAFCTRSQELLDGLSAAFSDQADAASVRRAFEQAAAGFRRIEPPAAVADDWAQLADGLAAYAQAFADLDESDPESVTAFQEHTGRLQGELTGAATGVESYLATECGLLDVPPSSGSAAPSS